MDKITNNKPENLIYGVDDIPPFHVLILQGIQHIFVLSSTFVLPVVIVQQLDYEFSTVRSYLALSMIACGIGTILQTIKRGRIGSGYFIPNLCGPTFLSVTLSAGWLGGFPLMAGMTIFAGLVEALFSFFINKIKRLFPVTVVGLVVVMVGIALVPLGLSNFTGVEMSGDSIRPDYLIVAVLTLSSMLIANFNKGFLKVNSVLIGMFVGYILSWLFGITSMLEIQHILDTPFFALPVSSLKHFSWDFDFSLILPFAIVAICASLKSTGNIITAQKINDKNWKEADMENVGKGLLADSMGIISAGLLGGMACDTSASNVGTTLATGVTSRVIGYSTGVFLIIAGFLPKFAAIFSIMPPPVIGAILVFVICFMVASGLQIMLADKMDIKNIFVIGISFALGLSTDIMPTLYNSVPIAILPIFKSSLTLSATAAVVLNFLLSLLNKKIKRI